MGASDDTSVWRSWHSMCVGHRVHSPAVKTMAMEAADVRGIARTLLSFVQPSVLHGFQARIHELVEKMATLIRHAPALSQEAIEFRAVVMQCFVPRTLVRDSFYIIVYVYIYIRAHPSMRNLWRERSCCNFACRCFQPVDAECIPGNVGRLGDQLGENAPLTSPFAHALHASILCSMLSLEF